MSTGNERVWYMLPMIRVEDFLDTRLRLTAAEDWIRAQDEKLKLLRRDVAALLEERAAVSRETGPAQPELPLFYVASEVDNENPFA